MAKKLKYKSDAFDAIHGSVAAMYRIGTIDEETMRSFDKSCLVDPSSRQSETSDKADGVAKRRD